ncbi:MAG: hypothetical protein O7C75_19330 [Verrucomicrobia bacterium]|nr:hypothetical protein [Verrucomicrobiota bacterium]
MSIKKKYLARFDRWLFESYSFDAKQWGLFRIIYALFMLVLFGLPQLVYLDGLPDAFFKPPRMSIGQFASGFPDLLFLQILGLLIVVAYLCILFGYRTKTASIAGVLLAFFAKTFVYSLGQINHDFMVWLVPLAGAFANWGAGYSIDAKNRSLEKSSQTQSWPIVLLVIIFCFAFALSGIHKILGGWTNLDLTAVQQMLARSAVVSQRDHFLAPFFLTFNNYYFWKAIDFLTLFFEIGIVVGIFLPRVFRIFLMAAVGFHAANLLMLNIDFSFNFAFYALFLNWVGISLWVDQSARAQTILSKMLTWRTFLVASILYLVFFFLTESSLIIFALTQIGFDYLGNAFVRILIGVGVVLWAIAHYLKTRSTPLINGIK